MNTAPRILTFCLIFFGWSAGGALAQLQPGMIDMMPSINTTIDNMINTRRAETLAGRSGSAEAARRDRAGKAKINSGKATTVIVPSTAGTRAIVKKLQFDPDEPQTEAGQITYVKNQVSRFNARMKDNSFTPYDFAQGYGLAVALSHEAYYDKKLDNARLQKVIETVRREWLSNVNVQGAPDWENQTFYDLNAIMAIQAIEWREKARSAQSAQERRTAEVKAKEYAGFMLQVKY